MDIQYQIDLGNLAVALIALIGLIAAWKQLKTMQRDSQTQILATRASVLLGLDERFAAQPMLDARAEMGGVIQRVNTRADEKFKGLSRKERRERGLDFYPDELEKMRTANPPDPYIRLMGACSFFETVGYVTNCEYVPLRDILKLFGPSIEDAGILFGAHINKLREDQSEGLYDNFVWLIQAAKEAKQPLEEANKPPEEPRKPLAEAKKPRKRRGRRT